MRGWPVVRGRQGAQGRDVPRRLQHEDRGGSDELGCDIHSLSPEVIRHRAGLHASKFDWLPT